MQCRQTARYNYGVFKSEAKHSVKGAFLSLAQSLLQLSLGPVDFNPLVFKTCLQGREAALSMSCRVRSEKHQVWKLVRFASSKKGLELYCSHLQLPPV